MAKADFCIKKKFVFIRPKKDFAISICSFSITFMSDYSQSSKTMNANSLVRFVYSRLSKRLSGDNNMELNDIETVEVMETTCYIQQASNDAWRTFNGLSLLFSSIHFESIRKHYGSKFHYRGSRVVNEGGSETETKESLPIHETILVKGSCELLGTWLRIIEVEKDLIIDPSMIISNGSQKIRLM